jgi:hypothetical protein
MKGTTMDHKTDVQPEETPHTRWQRRMAVRPLPPVQTTWGMEVAPLHTLPGSNGEIQAPPDLVVKFQPLDIVDVISVQPKLSRHLLL